MPILEAIAQSEHDADSPETWRVPEIGRLSVEKTRDGYQINTLESAAHVSCVFLINPCLWWVE